MWAGDQTLMSEIFTSTSTCLQVASRPAPSIRSRLETVVNLIELHMRITSQSRFTPPDPAGRAPRPPGLHLHHV